MKGMKISFYGATDTGRVRGNNEDDFITRYIWDKRHILLVVIDGMGGEEGGEIAASIAKNAIVKFLEEFQDDTILNLIKRALTEANNQIVHEQQVQPALSRMGCVITAGIVDLDEETLTIAHVGDSRLYRYSEGELSKITHDHSPVGYQEEQGILTEKEAMNHPERSMISRVVGGELHQADDKYFIEAGIFPLVPGETFVFCSDGLSDMLTSREISACLEAEGKIEEECKSLISKANEAGGKDNVTVIVARVENFPREIKKSIDTDRKKTTKATSVESKPNDTKSEDAKPNKDKESSESDSKFRFTWVAVSLIVLIICMVLGLKLSGSDESDSKSNIQQGKNSTRIENTTQPQNP